MATGCYLVMLALDVFDEKPHQITVGSVSRNDQGKSLNRGFPMYFTSGVDEAASITLSFSENRFAQLVFTGNSSSACQAQICGSNGHFVVSRQNVFEALLAAVGKSVVSH